MMYATAQYPTALQATRHRAWIHRFIKALVHRFTTPSMQWFMDSLIYWFMHLLIHEFRDSLVHRCIDSLAHWFVHGASLDSQNLYLEDSRGEFCRPPASILAAWGAPWTREGTFGSQVQFCVCFFNFGCRRGSVWNHLMTVCDLVVYKWEVRFWTVFDAGRVEQQTEACNFMLRERRKCKCFCKVPFSCGIDFLRFGVDLWSPSGRFWWPFVIMLWFVRGRNTLEI